MLMISIPNAEETWLTARMNYFLFLFSFVHVPLYAINCSVRVYGLRNQTGGLNMAGVMAVLYCTVLAQKRNIWCTVQRRSEMMVGKKRELQVIDGSRRTIRGARACVLVDASNWLMSQAWGYQGGDGTVAS